MLVDNDIEVGERVTVVDGELLVGVADIEDVPSGSKAWAELVKDPLDKEVCPPGDSVSRSPLANVTGMRRIFRSAA